jgi:type II secretory pathway component GspD/PulD (secretin)
LAFAIALISPVSAQAPADMGGQNERLQTRPSRVRNALRRAQDYYRKGDYELASTYFQQAQAGQEELTPAEQKELSNWFQLNHTALQARREGAIKLRQVEEATRQGRTQDAVAILKTVSQNQQFLTGADKQKIQFLNEQLMPGGSGAIQPAGTGNPAALAQARTMLRQARVFMSEGKYDAAQRLAHDAEQKGVTFGQREDTPEKVLTDIARMRSAPAVPDDPKSLLVAARQSLARGDLDAAEQFARESEKSSSFWDHFSVWRGDSPAKVLREVNAARAKQARQVTKNAVPTQPAVATKTDSADSNRSQSMDPRMPVKQAGASEVARVQPPATDSRLLLKQARELYNAGNLEEAKKLARRADATKSKGWGLFEDSPDKLLSEIRKTETKRDQEASVRILAEAREQFRKGNLQEAERLSHQAERKHGPYNVWELGDRPQKLRADIEAARNKERKKQLPPLPNDLGKTETEKSSTSLRPAPAPVIATGQDRKRDTGLPPVVTTAPNSQVSTTPDSTSSGGKMRAQMLVAEARQLQKEGRLVEARQKATDAQRIGANFAPDEDRPEVALIQISYLCQQRIDRLVQQATDCAQTAGSDANRCRRAVADLMTARQLAVGFGLDTHLIDSKLAETQPARDKSTSTWTDNVPSPVSQMHYQDIAAPAGVSLEQHGRDLLDQARRELRAGQTGNARALAVAAFDPKYNMQNEAGQVLRSIDVEEFNQKMLVANRAFDAGIAAFDRREYSQAATIMRSIEPQLLSPEKQARLKEVMLTPDMQPGVTARAALKPPVRTVQLVGNDTAPGRAQATDFGPAQAVSQPDPDFAAQVRAMQQVKFQKLRAEGNQALTDATKRFNTGDTDGALDLLQEYVASLSNSGLDADSATLLRRPVETRMQQLRTVKHQRDFEKLQASETQSAKQHVTHAFLAEEEKKKQVSELMKQFNVLFKEAKYQEAEVAALKARELDPDNAIAGAAISLARTQANLTDSRKAKESREEHFVKALNRSEDEGPFVDSDDPLKLDAKVAKLNKDRKPIDILGVTPSKTEKEREIYRRLDNPINSMDYKDTTLRQILDDLQGWTGINIVPDEPALQEAGITLDRPVTMKLEGVALKSALNVLLHQVHLTYVVTDEVLNITTEDHARGKLVTRIHPVLDLVIPVENSAGASSAVRAALNQNLGEMNNLKLNNTMPYLGLNSMGGGQNISQMQTLNNVQVTAGAGTPTVTKETPKGTLEDVLIKLVTNTIAPQSWASVGGQGTIDFYPLGMALVINQTPDIQEQVAELLAALRRLQDQEVAVEVRFISLAESFFERIGLDFNINIRNENPRYEPQLVSQQFQPFGFINRFSPSRLITGLTPAGSFTQDLGIPIKDNSFQMAVPPFGNFPNAPGANGGLSLGLAFLSDIDVFLFMEAAQGDQRTNVMQAPKLTLFNGQTSTVNVTDEQFFVTAVTVVQVGGQVVFIPVNTIIPTGGVSLTVNAVISADRRFVRLSLVPTLTNLASAPVPLFPITTIITPIFEGGAVGQPVPFTQFLQQPSFNTINVTTTVNVPDGGTVLMGGLKRLSEGRQEFGPPVLSKIPYINRLFKNVGYGRQSESLLMMVTPRIIINEEEEQRQVGAALTPTP